MTRQIQTTSLGRIRELLAEDGFDGSTQAVNVLLARRGHEAGTRQAPEFERKRLGSGRRAD